MSTDNTPGDETGPVPAQAPDTPQPGHHLKPHQLEHLAVCIASGHPAEVIADAMQVDLDRIQRALNQYQAGKNELLQQLVARYRVETLTGAVQFNLKMRDHWDQAFEVVGATLDQEKDLRLRYEAAWDIFATQGYIRERDKKAPAAAIQNNIFADERVSSQLVEHMTSMQNQVTDLKGSLSPLGRDRHLQHDHSPLPSEPTVEEALQSHERDTSPVDGNGKPQTEIEVAVEVAEPAD